MKTNFKLLAKLRMFLFNSNNEPLQSDIYRGVRFNFTHYKKVLEAHNG